MSAFATRLRNPLRLRTLERYVMIHALRAVGMALAVITAIILLINFVEISRTVGVRAKDAGLFDILGLALLQTPGVVILLLPFAFLFGTLGAFVSLNRRSELVAMRAAGVSAWRFILPAATAAAAIGVVTVLALNPLSAAMTARFQQLQTAFYDGADKHPNSKAIWLRQATARQQVIVRAHANQGRGVHLTGVSMFIYAVAPGGGLQFSQRIDASDAVLQPGGWRLSGVRQGSPGSLSVSTDTLIVPSTLNERTALERFSTVEAIPFWGLPSVIQRTEQSGFSATVYRLQLQQLLATPVMYAAMALLAAAFSLRLLRLGGLVRLAASGVALGFVLFFFDQLCGALGKADVIPPFLAAWSPPVLALLAGFTLLCYTEDG